MAGKNDRIEFEPVESARVYTVYTMRKTSRSSTSVLTIRVPRALDRKLSQEARRRRNTRSEVARALLESALSGVTDPDPAVEAARQSRLASARESDADALEFITSAADLRGWK